MDDALSQALAPLLAAVSRVDPSAPDAAARLTEALPLDDPAIVALRAIVREGVASGELASRESGGVRFGRVRKPGSPDDFSIDLVHMASPGPGHTHPQGEFDLCFAVSGSPTFDGRPEGWTVYPPGSWHVPTVQGGTMDILYFLPGGAIRFEGPPGER